MIGRNIIISLLLTLVIYCILGYMKFKYQNHIINKVNACILQSTMMYYNNMDIEYEEINKFKNFIIIRIRDNKLEEYIKDINIGYIDSNRISVLYNFRRGEDNFQNISFDVKKNV